MSENGPEETFNLQSSTRRRGKSVSFKLILILSLISTPIFTAAILGKPVDSVNLEKQKNDLQRRRQIIKADLNKKRLKQKDLFKVFRQVDEELARTNRELHQKNRDLAGARAQEQYCSRQLQTTRSRYAAYRNKYKDRLVSYYKNGHAGYLEVLFNSDSFSDFVSRVTYLRILTMNDLAIMDKMKEMQREIAEKKEKVENARKQIETDAQLLVLEKQHIAEVRAEKRKALDEIDHDVGLLERQEAELERESRRIEQELARSAGPGPQYRFNGRFDSPVCGRSFKVTSNFGRRSAPCRGCSTNHDGIDLHASYGSTICAAADGRVFQTGYINGYGYTVIIQHGSGYATLYAHASSILVSEGQDVKKGQLIMRAGSSGRVKGPHLHFEIRVNGRVVDPLGYFR